MNGYLVNNFSKVLYMTIKLANIRKILAIFFLTIGLFPWYRIYSASRPLTEKRPRAAFMFVYFAITILFIVLGLQLL